MKSQDQSAAKTPFAPSILRELQAAYRQLDQAISGRPWLVQGSVNVVAPRSAGGNVTYTWTRKIRAKTATVALSETQAEAFREAIAANRRLEEALAELRAVSQSALLDNLPGVSRRLPDSPRKHRPKTVPKVS
jgi:hypothetical protein